MYPVDLAFIHMHILLRVWFLFRDMYCTEMGPFAQSCSLPVFKDWLGRIEGFQEAFPVE